MNRESLNTSGKVFFPNLDGLRTIAFLLVYIQHGLWSSFKHLHIHSDFSDRLIYGVANGATGVSVFFVLSGFLITYLLLTEEKTRGRINVGFFYLRRVLRIWPLFFAVLIFAFLIYPAVKSFIGIDSHLATRPLYYFMFLSNFDVIHVQKNFPGADAMMETITWSVSIEEQFYLVWPLLFLVVPKRFYQYIFLFIIGISLMFRYFNRTDDSVIYFHTFSVCADLAVGGVCAYYCVNNRSFISFFKSLSKPVIISSYVIGFLWLLYGKEILNDHLVPLVHRLISTVFFVFIILEQNFSTASFYKFSRFRILTSWGKYTYGLYLLHPIALLILDITLRTLKIPYKESFILSFVVGAAGLGLSLLLSYISYKYFESFFLKLKEKFSFIHKKSQPPTNVVFIKEGQKKYTHQFNTMP